MSEEFLYTVLQQVDNLCDIIRNGDADLERTLEVNQNLNNAVSCYRIKLDVIDSKILKWIRNRNKVEVEWHEKSNLCYEELRYIISK